MRTPAQGKISYFFVGGTSQATPHVTGIVALLLQRDASLTPAEIQSCLEAAAETHPLADVGQTVRDGPGPVARRPLGLDH